MIKQLLLHNIAHAISNSRYKIMNRNQV